MASGDLLHLWKLHLIDAKLVELRARAASLDPGRAIMAKIKSAEEERDARMGEAKSLGSELTDLELQQKGMDDKLKRFDKELYGGKVVNPREVEAIEKEIAMIKRQRGALDERILELWELVPPAKDRASAADKVVADLRAELVDFQKGALAEKAKIEAEFKEASARRGSALAEVPAGLLSKYDAIRNRHEGIGLSRIQKNGACERCGTKLPTKVVEDVKDERVVTCESCHRILYYSESIV